MVSSGTVNNDLNSFKTSLTSYNTNIEGLDSVWKGPSHDNLVAKADEFYNEYLNAIQAQMTAFAAACDAYVKYQTAKTNLGIARSNYEQAIANKDNSAAAGFAAEISRLEQEIQSLKAEIEADLAKASSPKLTATSIAATTSESGADATATTLSASQYDVVNKALSIATEIAQDDSIGYSQARRFGRPDYDCSSFVISCYQKAGIPLYDNKKVGYTGSMKNEFVKSGYFEWIPGNPKVSDLRPGDILLNPNSHTEMYYGDGKVIGARSGDLDGRPGDSSGREVGVTKYFGTWAGVLRYTGGNENQDI